MELLLTEAEKAEGGDMSARDMKASRWNVNEALWVPRLRERNLVRRMKWKALELVKLLLSLGPSRIRA